MCCGNLRNSLKLSGVCLAAVELMGEYAAKVTPSRANVDEE
jgi:hypothetical protein